MIKLLSLLAALFSQAEPAPEGETAAPARGPVVVELFTSQGCPMCPDANALLEEIGGDDAVIAIAYGVGYWDMYGWADEFARPEFMARQQAYVDAGEAMRVYTPHFVINGAPEKMRFSADTVRSALSAAEPLAPLIEIEGGAVRLDGAPRETPAQIWRVDYTPGAVTRQIGGGANSGREMEHFNMASAVTALGDWTGGAMTLSLAPLNEGESCAILIQDGPGGRILAAARLD
ncbi:MAG: DUF1223 domain-containing protein [Oceanicaulis sp.]